jgi:hypothetical protein
MGKYRYPPDFNEVRNEDGDPSWQVTEIMQDGEINVQTFSNREEALEELERLRSEDNPQPEEAEPAEGDIQPVEAVEETPDGT